LPQFSSKFVFRLLNRNVNIKRYETVIIYVVLYECETWSLPLSEELEFRFFENIAQRRIFGPKREEAAGY
jgi:hypothetical protein